MPKRDPWFTLAAMADAETRPEDEERETPAAGDDAAAETVVEEDPPEALVRAEDAFERGDYAAVRALAAPLARGEGPEAEAAADLLDRIRVDPAQVAILVGCLLFFLFIAWKYVS
jgi:hypothetical protein